MSRHVRVDWESTSNRIGSAKERKERKPSEVVEAL